MNPLDYPGVNVALMGPPGTGKTHALASFALAGVETFVVFLEPGLESLIGAFTDKPPRGRGLLEVPKNVHWHNLEPKQRSFALMKERVIDVGKYDQKFLANYKDPKRADFNRFEALYACLNNFIDQRGQEFGSVENWQNDRVICIDGATGLGEAALEMMTGDKVVRDKPDFGIAQHNLSVAVKKLTQGCKCHFVLICHVDRYLDDISQGGMKLFPSLPGKALQSSFTQPFSDVILTVREADKWTWDTANSSADLKTRNLDVKSKIVPDFATILASWRSRRDAAVRGSAA